MKPRSLSKPQSLTRHEEATVASDDSAFHLACMDDGLYGVLLKQVGPAEPVFLECAEVLGLAALVERHRAWLEDHALANHEWWDNEIAGRRVLVRLRRRDAPDRRVALSLHTENHLAWYGTPIRATASPLNLPAGDQRLQEYPKAVWEENAERQQVALVW